jgi:cyclase
MLKVRIIPVLTFNGFALVKTKQFGNPRMVGNPIQAARVFNSRNVDELVFTDITATYSGRKINLPFVKEVIDECFMPVTIGGGIRSLEDINDLLKIGADKVLVKNLAISDRNFIAQGARMFGTQCISVAIDARKTGSGSWELYRKTPTGLDAVEFARMVEQEGAGEIVLTSVDRDGMMHGFDTDLVNSVLEAVNIPVVAVGGGGSPDHFLELFQETNVKAAGASAIFYFTQFTSYDIKKKLGDHGFPARFMAAGN